MLGNLPSPRSPIPKPSAYTGRLRADPALAKRACVSADCYTSAKRHEQRRPELAIALARETERPGGVLCAHVRRRTARALGKIPEAARITRKPVRFFPARNRAARAKQAALFGADMPGAAEPIRRLGQPEVPPATRETRVVAIPFRRRPGLRSALARDVGASRPGLVERQHRFLGLEGGGRVLEMWTLTRAPHGPVRGFRAIEQLHARWAISLVARGGRSRVAARDGS